jgi:predicted metal-dependent hydrolase
MTIIKHRLGDIECVRSLRARSIRLKVCSDGSLRVTYPIFSSRAKAIAFVESKERWIVATRRRLEQHHATSPTITVEEVERLREEARKALPPLVAELASRHGFCYTSLRISSAHTRWGSCSGNNSISLSLFLMLLPDHLREFVILHELCHTHHHNHSAAFHTLLNSLTEGREKALNKELKAYRIPRIV